MSHQRIILLISTIFLIWGCDKTVLNVTEPCVYGDFRYCTDGSEIGACQRGKSYCDDNGWGPCEGEIVAVPETCDGWDNDCDGVADDGVANACGGCGLVPREVCDGADNDCDGVIDEGLSHIEELCNGDDDDCDGIVDEGWSKRVECEYEEDYVFQGTSTCERGYRLCIDGEFTECLEFVGPTLEVCDGLDNDCDGWTDDIHLDSSCGVSDVGICQLGTPACVPSQSEIVCYNAIHPETEICDGLDNDCDGEVDEGLTQECTSECESGLERCETGEWVGCTARLPSNEVCDGEDNDCNGLTDEGCLCSDGETRPCMNPICGWGLQICEDGEWQHCEGQIPLPETCNNFDDNCNELIDEELVTDCFDGDDGQLDVGVCQGGESTCVEGRWSECNGQILPTEERCDGLDNDCDGVIDNMERRWPKVDMIFAIDVSGSMEPYINAVIEVIEVYATSLAGTDHRFGLVTFGSSVGGAQAQLQLNLAEVGSFVIALRQNSIDTNGAIEPSLDTIIDIATARNPLSIGWRQNATPIVILMGDEQAQSIRQNTCVNAFEATHPCDLPGCNSITNEVWVDGDTLPLFIFARSMDFNSYGCIMASDMFDLLRLANEDTRSIDLDLIFSEICIE